MAPAAVPETLPCESGAVFAREVKEAKDILSLEETEESWEKIRRSICRLHALYKGGGWQFEQDVVPGLKTLLRSIIDAMNSDRSKLSFEAIDLVSSLASLGRAFEPLLNLLFDALLKLCLKTSRILVARVQVAISRVVEETTLPGILIHLREAVKDKNQNLRTVASDAVLLAMNTFAPRDLAVRVGDIEEIIRSTGRDANPGVRQVSRKIFEAYQILFPERVDGFTAPLTPIMKKYLNVKARPVLNKSTKAVPFLPPHELAPASAPSSATEFPTAHGHTRSASASESLHARREPTAAPVPQLRSQRSRPAMRAEMPPPSAPEHAAHSFQPARSAPAPAQRQRTQSTLSAKAAQSATLAVDSARRGPQRVLAEPQLAPSIHVPGPEHPRIVSGPARVQRPATALGTVSSSSTMGPPATVTTHRAQRVLVPQPPPPPPEKPAVAERAPSRQEKERERPTHSRTNSNSNNRSNPPTRPGSAASIASRTKVAAATSKPAAAPSRPPLSKSAASTSRPPLSKSASTRPPVPSSHSGPQPPKPMLPVNCTMPLPRTLASSTSSSHSNSNSTSASNSTKPERTGFVPKRNHAPGGGGATQMTASALARAKELREARERAAAAKVKVAKKPAARKAAPAPAPAKPIEVPLPPSPGCPPREVPLPSSRSPSPLEIEREAGPDVDVEAQSAPHDRDEVIPPLVLAEFAVDKENVPFKTEDAEDAKVNALEVAALVAKLAPIALEEQAAADSFGPLDTDEEELAGVVFATGHAFDAQGEIVRAVPRERMVLGAVNAQ